MLKVPDTNLWVANASDLRDIATVLNAGVTAIVDLAIEEPVPAIPRTLNYCRFVLTDDGENDPGILRTTILTTTEFLIGDHHVAIGCSAGVSRSIAIAAAAVSRVSGQTPREALEVISNVKHPDINPALWNQILQVLRTLDLKSENRDDT